MLLLLHHSTVLFRVNSADRWASQQADKRIADSSTTPGDLRTTKKTQQSLRAFVPMLGEETIHPPLRGLAADSSDQARPYVGITAHSPLAICHSPFVIRYSPFATATNTDKEGGKCTGDLPARFRPFYQVYYLSIDPCQPQYM